MECAVDQRRDLSDRQQTDQKQQQAQSGQVHQAFLSRLNPFAAHRFQQHEYQPTAIQPGIGSRFVMPNAALSNAMNTKIGSAVSLATADLTTSPVVTAIPTGPMKPASPMGRPSRINIAAP